MKRHEKIKTEYLCYLMNRAQIDAAGDNGYFHLCLTMMEYHFLPIVYMDENRSYECRTLRSDFADECDPESIDILDELYGDYGTMMELLTVLAEKMRYNLMDSEYEAGTGQWFKEMLQNCGLDEYCNSRFNEGIVFDILDRINYRKYGFDGEGGLFPLRLVRQDQRYTELIVQMNNYIEENYDIC